MSIDTGTTNINNNTKYRYFSAERDYRFAKHGQRIGLFASEIDEKGQIWVSTSVANPSFERFNRDKANQIIEGRFTNEVDLGLYASSRYFQVLRYVREANNYYKKAPNGAEVKPVTITYTRPMFNGKSRKTDKRVSDPNMLNMILIRYDEYVKGLRASKKAQEAADKLADRKPFEDIRDAASKIYEL